METQEKSGFEYVALSVGLIKFDGKVYNASRVGPGKFNKLRQSNYGGGFRQATFGEVLALAHQSYLNQGNAGADRVISSTRQLFLSGNTAISYTPELVIVQDMPEVRDGRIIIDEKNLTAKLSKNLKNGVRFSDDGSIRAIEYGFAKEWQTSDQMKSNLFSIALTGDVNAPQKLAEIQDKIGKRGYIWVLGEVSLEIHVPVLNESDDRLGLGGFGWVEFDDVGCSFGIRQ